VDLSLIKLSVKRQDTPALSPVGLAHSRLTPGLALFHIHRRNGYPADSGVVLNRLRKEARRKYKVNPTPTAELPLRLCMDQFTVLICATTMKVDPNNLVLRHKDTNPELIHLSDIENLTTHANRLETLLKNLPGMAYRCLNLPHWPMDFVSQGCFELCGYHRHEIESQHILWGDFTHPDDISGVDQVVRKASEAKASFEVEYRIISRNGVEKWVWERGRPVDVREDGVVVLEGFITDITDRKNSETELVQAKAHAHAIVDSAAEGIITIDSKGHIESFNSAAQNMFGFTLEDVLSKHSHILLSENYRDAFESFIDAGSCLDSEVSFSAEVKGTRKDQSEFPVNISVNRIDNAIENQFVIITRDLSIERAAEKEAREQRELLAHADRLNTLGEMAAGIAHEMNQPLTAISMYAKSGLRFLQGSKPNITRLGEALTRLDAQAIRAGAVMERMQSMTKRRDSEQEPVDTESMLKEVHRLAEVEARLRHYVIELVVEDDLPKVQCDPIQIQQVILNLLRNGMESMTSAGRMRHEHIILSSDKTDIGVRISIEDCGCGISVELSRKLYQPFTSTKKSGMGLGLSISRSIVAAHGGQLQHANNRFGGATFSFELQLA